MHDQQQQINNNSYNDNSKNLNTANENTKSCAKYTLRVKIQFPTVSTPSSLAQPFTTLKPLF